jgi:hypothetical protein
MRLKELGLKKPIEKRSETLTKKPKNERLNENQTEKNLNWRLN